MTLIDISTLTSSSIYHSTETFYGIICSGLTSKMKRSFISSNSSFTECLRKDGPSLYFLSNSNVNDDNCRTNCTFDDHQVSLPSTVADAEYEFFSCTWKQCSESCGGAILCTYCTGSSLTVTRCYFSSCTCSEIHGGAIYASQISTFYCLSSFFYDCHSYALDGGGIQSIEITQCNSFKDCFFVSNSAARYGGGLVVADIKTTSCDCSFSAVVSDCRFLENNAEQGGGLHMRPSIDTHYICNSLISCNNATSGGGLQFWNDVLQSVSFPSFSFLFFSSNSATDGNDIQIGGTNLFSVRSFAHCFSSTRTQRIYPNKDVDWLP